MRIIGVWRVRTDRTKDTEIGWIQLRVEKICKTENIPIAKFLYKKVKRWFERNQFFLRFCRKKFHFEIGKVSEI